MANHNAVAVFIEMLQNDSRVMRSKAPNGQIDLTLLDRTLRGFISQGAYMKPGVRGGIAELFHECRCYMCSSKIGG